MFEQLLRWLSRKTFSNYRCNQYGWGRGRGGGWGKGRGRGGWRRGSPGWAGGGPVPPSQYQPAQPQIPPPPPGALRVAITTDDNNGLDSRVSAVFARAPFVLFIDIVNGSVANVFPVQNPYAFGGGGAGIGFAQFLLSNGVRTVITSSVGANAAGILSQSGVAVYNVPPGTRVVDALRTVGLIGF